MEKRRQYSATCKECGKVFMAKLQRAMYCSQECQDKAHKKHMREVYALKHGIGEERKCETCGSIFNAKTTKSKYCSRRCGKIASNIRNGYCTYAKEGSEIRTCVVCGNEYETNRSRSRTCSKECAEIWDKIKPGRNKDKRLKGKIIDKDITLRRLAMRDNQQCKLCGLFVNWEDKYTNEDGYVICGSMYPSIDHIIPLSIGGMHEWRNIQLAHRGCNTKKSNLFVG